MRNYETFKIGLSELTANKIKTTLTMLGIIFGVASVIAMLSIGEGARQETLEQIELLGTNNIIINNKPISSDVTAASTNFSNGLTLKDANTIAELIPFVKYVTPQKEKTYIVTYKAIQKRLKITGTSENHYYTYNTKISEGKFFQKHHVDNYSNVCVIGPGIKSDFFKFEDPIGKSIKINDSWFRIIGITESKKNSSAIKEIGVQTFNQDIYIPITTMNTKLELVEKNSQLPEGVFIFDNDNTNKLIDRSQIDRLTVNIDDDKNINTTTELLKNIMARKHYNANDYEIIVPEAIIEQKQKTQKIFNIVMGAIAGISLLVGGIGIMNIMLANILQRTKEIGIRRAVGATQKDILLQFLFEAIIISVVGGIIGIIIGFLITSLITTYAEWRTIITPFSIITAFIVAVATGIAFGSYPAKQAALKDPIESIRYE